MNYTPHEDTEQKHLILELERLSLNNDIKFTAIPNSTFTTSWNQKRKNKEMGVRAGLPDLFLIINKKPLFIELKRIKGGVVSKEQKEWLQAINESGIEAIVCKGAEEALLIIKKSMPKLNTQNQLTKTKK